MTPIVDSGRFSVSSPSPMDFKRWREKRGWSIEQTAKMLDYKNVSAIYQIESGTRKVPKRVATMMHLYDVVEGETDEGNTAQTA